MSFNKKASLEISIQAIVIIVLAMTLLGLGLGFIRKQFTSLGTIQEEVSEQVKQKILDDLISGDKKISFPRTEIAIDKGSSQVLTVGVRNKKDSTLHYKMRFKPISNPNGESFNIETPKRWFQLEDYARQDYKLSAADSEIRNIRLNIPTETNAGSYFLTFEVIDVDAQDSDNVYAQKDFFVVVRG